MLLKAYVRIRTTMVCKKGQGLMEYALLAAIIAVGLIATVGVFGRSLVNKFTSIATQLDNAQLNP